MSEKLIAADIQKRFLFEISFEGQHYCGWQRQAAELEKNYKVSVQACLEKALKTLFSLRLEPKIRGCGRTDSGVHAQRYFFHVDLPVRDFREHKIRKGIQALSPQKSICCWSIREVDSSFDALTSVVQKCYTYQILLSQFEPVGPLRGRVWRLPHSRLEEAGFSYSKILEISKIFEGEHDFAAFASKGHSHRSTQRKIDSIHVTLSRDLHGQFLIKIRYFGKGFLKQMLRNITGSMVEYATGKKTRQQLESLLRSSTRVTEGSDCENAVLCAPAAGLCLSDLKYGKGF